MYSQYQKAITGIAIQDRTTIGQYSSSVNAQSDISPIYLRYTSDFTAKTPDLSVS